MKAQKEIARRERERLRLQEKLRKENLDKLRREQDGAAESDNVRLAKPFPRYKSFKKNWPLSI